MGDYNLEDMAYQEQCSRCKKTFIVTNEEVETLEIHGYGTPPDLCPECRHITDTNNKEQG